MHYDPVVRRLGFTGAHVNRAARIEPVAQPGEAFASEEFAALSELSAELARLTAPTRADADAPDEEGFVCEYAGSMALAKNYPGRYRIYRLLPHRVLPIETLAKAIHQAYCNESRARGDSPATNAALRPWHDLPEDLRNANRAQAADIPNKLWLLGYELAPSWGLKASSIALPGDLVETMAKREHDRWLHDRQRSGWSFGPVRDDATKSHPLIVPWDQLAEPEKQKDRDAVRNVPILVDMAGFRVRRLPERD
jgi:hypothetical protein